MVRRFASLHGAERALALEIAVITLAVTTALRILPFSAFVRAVSTRPRRMRQPAVSPHRIAQLVEGVARRIPGSTCLVQAVVLFHVLLRRGIATEVVVAAARTSGGLDAHAWVRFENSAILGGPEREGYAPLLVLRADSASSAAAA